MPDTIIKINNLGKKYLIRLNSHKKSDTLREVLTRNFSSLFNHIPVFSNSTHMVSTLEEIWALNKVNLEIKSGEVIGIIGRNGAGKSTLLKILSRITEPTIGSVHIKGRVASLLEVGTGFHPELTGRENIFLNGAILGMSKSEIKQKFDEIVFFSEIEKFLDTPVKRYSSGMRVRLAFAVAAHLEPDILLVDEVLAVGDFAFQKKCIGKMEDVAKGGRTVLFVSHNMQAVNALCSRSILIENGCITEDGPTADTIQKYYQSLRVTGLLDPSMMTDPKNRRGSGAARLTAISTLNSHDQECSQFEMGSTIRFRLSYEIFSPVEELLVCIQFYSGKTREILTSVRHIIHDHELSAGHKGAVEIDFPRINLRPGEYPLYFWLGRRRYPRAFDIVDDMTSPMIIYTSKNYEEIGYDPSRPNGFFNLESAIRSG